MESIINGDKDLQDGQLTSKVLDHLGIVAGVCNEIKLVEEIDKIVGVDVRQKVTCGEAVKSMVLNALGFVDRPLYLSPEFMNTKPVEMLIRKGQCADDFNDDVLGRALDKVYSYGPETIFMSVSASAYKKYKKYKNGFFHSDTTTISVEGKYKHEEGDLDERSIEITYGHPKQGRYDLKQFVISSVMYGGAPAFIKALSGNTSDKNHFREIAKQYGAQLREKWGEDTLWVWDSAGYSEKNVKEISPCYKWIMRVPETLSEAKIVIEKIKREEMEKTSLDSYRISTTYEVYGDIKQRWVVVFSDEAFKREKKTLEKNIKKEEGDVKKELWHFSNRMFHSKEDGLKELDKMKKRWRYHKVKCTNVITKVNKINKGRGKPKNGESLQTLYHINVEFEEDENAINKEKERKGKFIIATNELDEEKLSSEDVLKGYKDQQKVERGFRFLKDPLFFAHSIFLKNEERICAMVMIMGLALLVYSIAEKKLRDALKKFNETIPDQKNKPTAKPTIRRVFQMFEGIGVVYKNLKMLQMTNLTPVRRKILSLLGPDYERIYGVF